MCVCVFVCVCVCVHVQAWLCVHVHVQSCVYTSKCVHVVSCCNIVAELADDLPLRFHIIIHLCTQIYTRLVKGVKR